MSSDLGSSELLVKVEVGSAITEDWISMIAAQQVLGCAIKSGWWFVGARC
jgi:hypothetical protein